ncbi:MAG TPA: VTT domain-containing protein [Ktedonobacterales bacterium]|jgi:membrane protein DedA with SNARE-associated domain
MLALDSWLDSLAALYDTWGYLIVFFGALFENTALLGLLLPGGTLALLGAFYAWQGSLNIVWVIVFAWIGTALGYNADYLIGRFLLTRLTGRWSASWLGRRLRLAGRLRLARMFLARHGGKAILLSHIVGHVRSFVALSAGATRMRYRRFLSFELVAALLWNTGFCLLGYFAGSERERLQLLLERSGWVALLALGLGYGAWRLLRWRVARLRAARRLASSPAISSHTHPPRSRPGVS